MEILKLYAHPDDAILDYVIKKIDKINGKGVYLEVIPSNNLLLEGEDVYIDNPNEITTYIETGDFYVEPTNYEEKKKEMIQKSEQKKGKGNNRNPVPETEEYESDQDEPQEIDSQAADEFDRKVMESMLYNPQ